MEVEEINLFRGHGYIDNKSYYSLDPVPGVHLVSLDSASDSRLADTWAGGLSEEQIAWLDEDLNKSGDKTVIIMAHHALINHTGKNDSNWYIDNRDAVKEIMKKHRAQIIYPALEPAPIPWPTARPSWRAMFLQQTPSGIPMKRSEE